MPEGLPIKFSNVHYYQVAGKYVYAGDLFIARHNLYFFPEIDMEQQREEIAQRKRRLRNVLWEAGVGRV